MNALLFAVAAAGVPLPLVGDELGLPVVVEQRYAMSPNIVLVRVDRLLEAPKPEQRRCSASGTILEVYRGDHHVGEDIDVRAPCCATEGLVALATDFLKPGSLGVTMVNPLSCELSSGFCEDVQWLRAGDLDRRLPLSMRDTSCTGLTPPLGEFRPEEPPNSAMPQTVIDQVHRLAERLRHATEWDAEPPRRRYAPGADPNELPVVVEQTYLMSPNIVLVRVDRLLEAASPEQRGCSASGTILEVYRGDHHVGEGVDVRAPCCATEGLVALATDLLKPGSMEVTMVNPHSCELSSGFCEDVQWLRAGDLDRRLPLSMRDTSCTGLTPPLGAFRSEEPPISAMPATLIDQAQRLAERLQHATEWDVEPPRRRYAPGAVPNELLVRPPDDVSTTPAPEPAEAPQQPPDAERPPEPEAPDR